VIGRPLDMDVPICLNLARFVERSSGIFGKSGTGKTFLTRLLLIGIAQKDVAVNLVFDMHNEYGQVGTSEGGGKTVKGLKQLFRSKVAIFALDPDSSRKRSGVSPDAAVELGCDQIQPEDIAMVREAFGITEAGLESVYRLARHFGEERWLTAFLDTDAPARDALAQQLGLSANTLNVLHRKLENRLARLPFVKREALDNSVDRILEYLSRGVHVVLEFGRFRSLDAYILVANVLTRRIYDRYVEKVDLWLGGHGEEPKQLVITIEEAHKFLSPQVADLTIFGTIARELRKYHVTLLVVDQRPSSIADEVMSQIGSRITCLLDDEKDIAAVLSGISGAQALRGVLAKLDSKQQAIVLGHAVPTPVVVRTRDYGTLESYRDLGFYDGAELRRRAQQDVEELYGKD
jgi:DNA helicase HerA-like ATPase